jgi:hypothetical protein
MQLSNDIFHEAPISYNHPTTLSNYPMHLSSTLDARKKYDMTNKLLQNKLGESSTDI